MKLRALFLANQEDLSDRIKKLNDESSSGSDYGKNAK